MSSKSEIKLRVKRLLSGARNTRDLDRIFSWLRFRSFGFRAVRDVGDFAGHLEDRSQGYAWQGAQHLAAMVAYQVPRIMGQGRSTNTTTDEIDELTLGALGALELSPASDIKKTFGISKKVARKRLKTGLSKVIQARDKNISVDSSMTKEEWIILKRMSSILVSYPLLTDESLVRDLGEVLIRNGLMERSELSDLHEQRDFIALFALEKMHLTKLNIGDDSQASLNIGLDRYLMIQIVVTSFFSDRSANLAFPLMTTQCKPGDWLECWDENAIAETNSWHIPLEINSAGKLAPIDK